MGIAKPACRLCATHGARACGRLSAEAQAAHEAPFEQLRTADQDALLMRMQKGELKDPAWGEMSSATFFKQRMAHDIVHAYYAHPIAWNEVGWGGPASPRGYVRMGFQQARPLGSG